MKKIHNLKIKKNLVAILLGFGVLSLASNSNAAQENETEKESLYQRYERNYSNEEFISTNNYYIVENDKEIPIDSELTKYVYIGEFDLETYNNLLLSTISNNCYDAGSGNYIAIDKINKECFDNITLETYDEQVDRIISSDGTILGYTPKKKIMVYNSNYIYK